MASSSSQLFMLVVLCTCNLIQAATTRSNQACNSLETRLALFVFGDSLFDVGNNNYLKHGLPPVNHGPYGQTFFKYPTGRCSDGRNTADFIAEYMELPVILPYLLPGYHRFIDGANFASGGAGALTETYRGLVIDLKTQLHYFKNVETQLKQRIGDTETKSLLNKALFLFSVGGNDYIHPIVTNSTVLKSFTKEEYVGVVIGNITMVLKELYRHGGRRFGFLNLLPVGCTPLLRANQNVIDGSCVEEANAFVKLHNLALPKAFQKLSTQLDGFEYSIFDLNTALGERMRNPSKYGFKEGQNIACCGSGPYRGILNCGGSLGTDDYEMCEDPGEYVFFDGIHPTDKTNRQLATLMWSGSSNVSNPQNLKSLLHLRV